MPDPTTTTLDDLLRDTARFINNNDIGPDILSVNYAKPYCDERPTVRVHLRAETWATLCAGLPVTWDAGPDHATASAALPDVPGLLLLAVWSRADLETAAPEVAAMVFPPRVRYSAGAWPAVVRS